MWLANSAKNLTPSFIGGAYNRRDFDTGFTDIPKTYGLDYLSVYVHHVIPVKTVSQEYFTDKGITLNQTIIASSGLSLAAIQSATGVNELVPFNSNDEVSDELTNFYVLTNTLESKQLTLDISFTGVTSLDTIRPFISNPIVLYQESYYSVPRLIPFDSIVNVTESAIISQHIDTTTDNLYINKQTKHSYIYKRYNLIDFGSVFVGGNFSSIEHNGRVVEKELAFNGKGFVVTDEYVFILDQHVQ